MPMPGPRRLPVFAAAFLAAAAVARAGEADAPGANAFPFPMSDWNAADPRFAPPPPDAPAIAVDVSFLNDAPAGRHGRIVVKDGRFVEEGTGRRVRFVGVNANGPTVLPLDPALYDALARRLARAGINIVRLHHFDNEWGIKAGESIWSKDDPDNRTTMDPRQLDKLFRLVAACKKYGIYTNINLKVSRRLTEQDGMPPEIRQVRTNHQKGLDWFHPLWIQKQKALARDLLTAVNPHTGLALGEDPAVAFVEINNENSIQGATGDWATLAKMPAVLRRPAEPLWNAFLAEKYPDDAALRAAWKQDESAPGQDLLGAGMTWRREQNGGSRVTISSAPPADPHYAPTLTADVEKGGTADWHLQVDLPGLTLERGRLYTLSFTARADRDRRANVGVRRNGPPHNYEGLSESFAAGPRDRHYEYAFIVNGNDPGMTRIAFQIGQSTGRLVISNLRLREGAEGAGLREGESLAKRNLGLPAKTTPSQFLDWRDFLAGLDKAFADEMLDYLRDDLKIKSLVACSQIHFTTLSALEREERMDFADAHGYWNHPQFVGYWNEERWSVASRTQLADVRAAGGDSTLERLARFRVAGRPYAVSEYDHCAPDEFAAEMNPLLAVVAGRQDWDAIYYFELGQVGSAEQADRIKSWFEQTGHPGKIGFTPALAVAFRRGLFAPATREYALALPRPYHRQPGGGMKGAWDGAAAGRKFDILRDRLGFTYAPSPRPDKATIIATETSPPADDAVWFDGQGGPVLAAAGEGAAVVTGFVAGGAWKAGDALTWTVAPAPNPPGPAKAAEAHGAAMLVALDGRPLATSQRMLLTVAGRAENVGMGWNEARNSVGRRWGQGPATVHGHAGSVSIAVDGPRRVYALDNRGARRDNAKIDAAWKDGRFAFPIRPAEDRTMWYEIIR